MCSTKWQLQLAGLALIAGQLGAASRDWESLQLLTPGDLVRVSVKGKAPVTAEFGAVTADHLQLVRYRTDQFDIAKQDVRAVERMAKRSRARAAAAWIGLAAGFGIGFGVGYAGGDSQRSTLLYISKPALGAAVGGVGAFVGGLTGKLIAGRSSETVYKSH